MGRLEGKVALISGGARGQGATEARLFAQEGARVVVGDILDAAGQQVEEEIRAQGGEATYVHLDVTREADWVEAVGTAVNLKGVFLGTKQAIPAMRRAGGGSIINISSTAGLVGSPYGSASYTATKGGVRLFTKSTALQHAPDHIRCNSVHPGPIETAMLQEALADPTTREERLRRVPLGRVGTVDDIAYGVLYLASDESSFVTGSELVIDGGSTAQ